VRKIYCMLTITKRILPLGLIALPLLFIISSRLYAQTASYHSRPRQYWFNFGAGGSSAGLSFGASYSYTYSGRLVSARFTSNHEFDILGPKPEEYIWDLGMLYGAIAKNDYGLISISSGLAMVGGVRRGKYLSSNGWFSASYETRGFFTIGLPVEVQLFWTPTSFLGFGAYGFANLNPKWPFLGALFCLQLGAIR
jgi:hypothetical protein